MKNNFEKVIHFWFSEIDRALWFKKDTQFDQTIITRFSDLHEKASKGELSTWRHCAEGRLAEIIVLDQFSRNMYRESPTAFAQDQMALILAQEAITHGYDKSLQHEQKLFLYLPFMHSESSVVHEWAVEIFKDYGVEGNLQYEYAHKKIIDQFGRYPHRNRALKRPSSQEEIDFLSGPNSSF
jgi:uncharacterized protein (DUF924 family)